MKDLHEKLDEYHLNACKHGRHPALVPLGDGLAAFFDRFFREPTDDCPCCMAIRVLVLASATLGAGIGIGLLL